MIDNFGENGYVRDFGTHLGSAINHFSGKELAGAGDTAIDSLYAAIAHLPILNNGLNLEDSVIKERFRQKLNNDYVPIKVPVLGTEIARVPMKYALIASEGLDFTGIGWIPSYFIDWITSNELSKKYKSNKWVNRAIEVVPLVSAIPKQFLDYVSGITREIKNEGYSGDGLGLSYIGDAVSGIGKSIGNNKNGKGAYSSNTFNHGFSPMDPLDEYPYAQSCYFNSDDKKGGFLSNLFRGFGQGKKSNDNYGNNYGDVDVSNPYDDL